MRTAPTSSKESQGPIERCHQTLHDQVRTIRLYLAANYKIYAVDLHTRHPLMAWVTRHAALMINRLHGTWRLSYMLPKKIQTYKQPCSIRACITCDLQTARYTTSLTDTQPLLRACGWADTHRADSTSLIHVLKLSNHVQSEFTRTMNCLTLSSCDTSVRYLGI